MENHTILISGAARSGKDSICKCFISEFAEHGIFARRYAFADALKTEVGPLLFTNLGIDSFTEDAYEKNLIRPILLAWGQICRKVSENYWVEEVSRRINLEKKPHIAIISDCRYGNESDYFKSKDSIFITRYDDNGNEFPPVGDDEKLWNPILKEMADYKLSWNSYHTNEAARYYKSKQFFNEIFADKIPQWQNAFPLAKTT